MAATVIPVNSMYFPFYLKVMPAGESVKYSIAFHRREKMQWHAFRKKRETYLLVWSRYCFEMLANQNQNACGLLSKKVDQNSFMFKSSLKTFPFAAAFSWIKSLLIYYTAHTVTSLSCNLYGSYLNVSYSLTYYWFLQNFFSVQVPVEANNWVHICKTVLLYPKQKQKTNKDMNARLTLCYIPSKNSFGTAGQHLAGKHVIMSSLH